jgi:hypothetical protein
MPVEGQTGLVVPVPTADALLGLVESRHPGTVREGVPAHVSLLYPFVAAAELDEQVIRALSELVVGHEPMPVEFAECYRRGGFVALRPDPIERLTELTRKACERWPDLVPYEGLYGDVEPHVTVALRASEETGLGGYLGQCEPQPVRISRRLATSFRSSSSSLPTAGARIPALNCDDAYLTCR